MQRGTPFGVPQALDHMTSPHLRAVWPKDYTNILAQCQFLGKILIPLPELAVNNVHIKPPIPPWNTATDPQMVRKEVVIIPLVASAVFVIAFIVG